MENKIIDILKENGLEGENEWFKEASKDILSLFSVVSNRSKTKKVSSDGVFFRCDNCGFEPQMASSTDDLLIMHFCPKCGSEFE